MALTILEQMTKPGPTLFYDPGFKLIIETHLNILKTAEIKIEDIREDLFYQYEGNFYGYLMEIGIPIQLHFIYLRVNGMENPNQFGRELRDPLGKRYVPRLIRPSENIITTLQQYYLSRKN